MGNISLSFSDNKKKTKKYNSVLNKEKIYLKYYPEVKEEKERYTYINSQGEEVEFIDSSYIVYKTSLTKGEAKKVNINKINLNYIEGIEEVKAKPAYFSYNNGEEIFLDKPIYNKETNSYTGIIKINNIIDKEIKIFEY